MKIRPANPNAAHRMHGAFGVILDNDKIASYLDTITYDNGDPANLRPERSGYLLCVSDLDGSFAVIGTEGVGSAVPSDAESATVYAVSAWSYAPVSIPREIIFDAMTDETVDVADFVRVFGSRLDVNASIWRQFIKGS